MRKLISGPVGSGGWSRTGGCEEVEESLADIARRPLLVRLEDTQECLESTCAGLGLGALRYFAADDRRSQSAFGAVVGWLHSRIAQKAEQVVAGLLRANAIQEPLIVAVAQGPIQQQIVQCLIQFGDLLLERLVPQLGTAMSQVQAFSQPFPQLARELQGPPALARLDFLGIADEMRKTFLLLHSVQLLRVVTLAQIGRA